MAAEALAQTIREAVPHWVLGGLAAELGPGSVHTADCPACLVAPALDELLRLLGQLEAALRRIEDESGEPWIRRIVDEVLPEDT